MENKVEHFWGPFLETKIYFLEKMWYFKTLLKYEQSSMYGNMCLCCQSCSTYLELKFELKNILNDSQLANMKKSIPHVSLP